jgi:hypothetical protein
VKRGWKGVIEFAGEPAKPNLPLSPEPGGDFEMMKQSRKCSIRKVFSTGVASTVSSEAQPDAISIDQQCDRPKMPLPLGSPVFKLSQYERKHGAAQQLQIYSKR